MSVGYVTRGEYDALLAENERLREAAQALGHWHEGRAHWFDPTSTPMPGCSLCAALAAVPEERDG